jgi:hypothetical protein
MRPSPSSTRLAVPAFPDSYGPRYIRERSGIQACCHRAQKRTHCVPKALKPAFPYRPPWERRVHRHGCSDLLFSRWALEDLNL